MKLYKFFTVLLVLATISSANLSNANATEKFAPKVHVWVMSNYTWENTEGVIPNSNFNVKNARLILKGNGAKNWGYHIMGEMVGPTDKKPMLMQAWVSYKIKPFLRFRFGQFKYPLGAEAYSARILWKFVNPSYVTSGIVKKLGNDGSIFRDIGLEAAGEYSFSENLGGIYKLMIFNGAGANINDNNDTKDYVAFVGMKLPMNITMGGSYYAGESGIENTETDESAFGALLKVNHKSFTVQAEYITAKYESNSDVEPAGFYAYGTYMVTPAIEVGARYDAFDKNKNVANVEQSRITLLAGYYLNTKSRIFLNYEIREDDLNENLGNLLTIQLQAAF